MLRRAVARSSRPRFGGSCSYTTMLARGSRRRCPAFTSREPVTTLKPLSTHSCQTGERRTVPSRRYVARTATNGNSSRSPRSAGVSPLRTRLPARAADDQGPLELGRFRDLAVLDRFDSERRRLDRRQRVPVRVAADQVVQGPDSVLPLREPRVVRADVFEEEQAPGRLQHAPDLAQRDVLVRDAAEHKGDNGGVE